MTRTVTLDAAEAPTLLSSAVQALAGSPVTSPEDADKRPAIPFDGEFADGDDFLFRPELQELGDAVVAHWPEFEVLADAHIAFVWKRKGGKAKGKDVYGNCQKTGGLLRHFSRRDFVIWVAADHVRESGFTNLQLEAMLYHELKHIGFEIDEDEKSPTFGEMKFTIRGHDDEIFVDEIRRYGEWNQQRQRSGDVYRQALLTGGAS